MSQQETWNKTESLEKPFQFHFNKLYRKKTPTLFKNPKICENHTQKEQKQIKQCREKAKLEMLYFLI